MHPPASRNRSAFTLIELLVVISIIALLISILLPVLGGARGTARNVKCLSNLKQWGIALAIYTHESDGRLPQEGGSSSLSPADDPDTGRWYNALPKTIDLLPYHEVFAPGVTDQVFDDQYIWWCPEARAEFGPPTSTGTGRAFDYTWSYVLNGTGSRGPNYGTDHLQIDTIPPLSETLAISEPSGRNEGMSIGNADPDRHTDKNVNVLFLDSHVAGFNADSLNTVSSGSNSTSPRELWRTAEDDVVWGSFR